MSYYFPKRKSIVYNEKLFNKSSTQIHLHPHIIKKNNEVKIGINTLYNGKLMLICACEATLKEQKDEER